MTNMRHACRLLLPLLIAPLLLPVLGVLPPAAAVGAQSRQSASGDALFQKVASLDAKVFGAYNTCDLDTFASLFVDDVEFYHDKGGVMRGKEALVDAVKKNICGTTRRDPIPGTLEVHPMDGFGALQIGAHRFCEAKNKQCDGTSGGVGKYIHLWQNSGDVWKITRVISYDHASVKAAPSAK
jgi:ketosteroid isomerase-like protein